jgi:HK97 family phage portal protein
MFKFPKTTFSKKARPEFYNDISSYVIENSKAVWSDRNYTKFAEEAYLKNVIANKAVSLIATACGSVKFLLKENNQIATNHPLNKVILEPNPMDSISAFIERVVSYKLLSGNSFILGNLGVDGALKEIYTLRPDRIKIIEGKGNIPLGYKYQVNEKEFSYPLDQISYKSLILHLKSFNPFSDWYGISQIESARFAIDQHNQASEWNQALLQNSARPSGALIVKNESYLNEKQFSRLKNEIEQKFSGTINNSRPMILEGGLDWKEMSLSPKDMDFIESKNLSSREIALAFGVPPQMLGIPGDNTYSNLSEARLSLWEQTILPIMENLTTSLNNWFQKFYPDDNIELSIDKNSIDAVSEKRHKLWERVEKSTFMTVNEKRQFLGLPNIEGGDRLF